MSPFIYQVCHIFRPLAIKEHTFSCARMGKTECTRVQHLSRTEGEAVFDILFVFLRAQAFEYLASAVFLVAEKRVSYMLHMYAYLVCASGFESALDERDIWEALEYAPMRDGFLGLRALLELVDTVDSAVTVVARERTFNRTAVFFESAPNKGIIGAFRRMVEELLTKVRFRFGCFGDEQQAGSIFVDTMNETDIGIIDIDWTFGISHLEMPCEGMKERMLVVTVPGMNDESGGFVNDHEVVVFIDDIKGDILRRDGEVMRLMVEHHLNDIPGFDAIVGCNRRSIDPHITCVRSRLDTVSAGIGHVLREVLVHALFALTFVHLATPTLEEQIVYLVI